MTAAPAFDRTMPDGPAPRPAHVLMTLDAVGGVWRYALDLGRALQAAGTAVTFAGFGPQPDASKAAEAADAGRLVWLPAPLDWTAEGEAALEAVPQLLGELVARHRVDLVHLNLPSQAAGLALDVPVLAVSHSCVATWFRAVRGSGLPAPLAWHHARNAAGLAAADTVVAPSASHAAMLARTYGPSVAARVVPNAVRPLAPAARKQPFVFAAGRWWDEGKNGATLDRAAADARWPVLAAGPTHGPDGQTFGFAHARHLGEIPNTAARRHMAEAGIVVSPSIYEPFGLAALEAASGGAALVLADNATYRELWDGAALFAAPADAAGFAAAINRLADDDALRADLAGRARVRAAGFTQERQVRAMQGLYAAAMARRSEPRPIAV
ncbi:glycosyltransferase family 4 protein [Aquibium sp. A9E412]|uniref:glycosyltransferase family 4 protein n=1 Tax=Aquibium sp. A9E412 TaxID=2976767 RepID=UPI0025AED9D5|nr:glycosyltransferase family 4 protein [Aquibium sp. A9E412]MDN2564900.1 glycosyltransferase family 4 protein [Aquibium sp. A9E412]